MSKRKGKSKSSPKVQQSSRWPRFLLPGLLAVAVVIGAGTWFFLQKPSPQVVAAQYTGGPRLAVDNDVIDFGNVRFDKFVTARFRLRNVGDQPLRLAVDRQVEAIEGCWPSEVVVGSTTLAPGQETEVSTEFTMHVDMGGPHLFLIHVKTNDAVQPKRELRIRSYWEG